jgi:hypothetical protein
VGGTSTEMWHGGLMPDVEVWSEVDPSLRSYTDCTWCAILMAIVGSGFDAFPLGAYTHPERRAFRGTSAILNFSGPVAAAQARYGITVVRPAPYSPEELRAALRIPGRVYAVAGRLANYPAGHPRRRWDPTFAGFHAVAVQTLGDDVGRWLDPLAPMGFAGDSIDVDEVVDVFAVGNYPNDARYLEVAEDAMKLQGTPVTPLQNKKVTVRKGTTFVKDPARADVGANDNSILLNGQHGFPADNVFIPDWKVTGTPVGGNPNYYHGLDPAWGTFEYGYIPEVGLIPFPDGSLTAPIEVITVEVPVPGPTPTPPPPDPATELAIAQLNLLTVDLNNVAKARASAVTHKNNAKRALGG